MKNGIAVAGSLLVDKIYGIDAYPSVGELTKIKSCDMSVGGCVPNVSIDIKRIANDIPVFAIGKTGSDGEAKYLTEELKKYEIDTKNIKSTEDKTSFTDVMSIEGDQRTFFTYPGASAHFGALDIDLDALNAKMLHLGYFLLLDKIDNGDGVIILKKALERGISTSIDLVSENSDRYSLVIPALKYTDNLIINELEAGMLTGMKPTNGNLRAIAESLKGYGVRERVIIHKPDLSVCLSPRGFTALPSYELPNGYIKGSTGAGDAFCAGALVKIYRGASDLEILEFASSAAVTALSEKDATSGVLSEAETVDLCKKFKRSNLCL